MGSGEQFNSDWRVLKTMESHGGDLGIALGGGVLRGKVLRRARIGR
jgi:hypothetical protein